jgi:hypothetical protein
VPNVVTLVLSCDDVGKPLSAIDVPVMFEEVNIHCFGNPAYYGSGVGVSLATQGAATPDCSNVAANAVLTFKNLLSTTIFFKNFTNAATAVIVATGTVKT